MKWRDAAAQPFSGRELLTYAQERDGCRARVASGAFAFVSLLSSIGNLVMSGGKFLVATVTTNVLQHSPDRFYRSHTYREAAEQALYSGKVAVCVVPSLLATFAPRDFAEALLRGQQRVLALPSDQARSHLQRVIDEGSFNDLLTRWRQAYETVKDLSYEDEVRLFAGAFILQLLESGRFPDQTRRAAQVGLRILVTIADDELSDESIPVQNGLLRIWDEAQAPIPEAIRHARSEVLSRMARQLPKECFRFFFPSLHLRQEAGSYIQKHTAKMINTKYVFAKAWMEYTLSLGVGIWYFGWARDELTPVISNITGNIANFFQLSEGIYWAILHHKLPPDLGRQMLKELAVMIWRGINNFNADDLRVAAHYTYDRARTVSNRLAIAGGAFAAANHTVAGYKNWVWDIPKHVEGYRRAERHLRAVRELDRESLPDEAQVAVRHLKKIFKVQRRIHGELAAAFASVGSSRPFFLAGVATGIYKVAMDGEDMSMPKWLPYALTLVGQLLWAAPGIRRVGLVWERMLRDQRRQRIARNIERLPEDLRTGAFLRDGLEDIAGSYVINEDPRSVARYMERHAAAMGEVLEALGWEAGEVDAKLQLGLIV